MKRQIVSKWMVKVAQNTKVDLIRNLVHNKKFYLKLHGTLVLLVLLVCLVLAAGFGGLEWWEADVCPLVLLPVALLVVDFEDVDFWKMKVSHVVITTVS